MGDDLKRRDDIYLSLDNRQMGAGGHDSGEAQTHPEYTSAGKHMR
jgi:hypothetical protein